MRKIVLSGIFIVLVIVCLSANAVFAQGGQYVVNTTSDTVVAGACAGGGAGCSLRGAIQEANSNPNADNIIFVIPGSDPGCSAGVCTINLSSVLPTISTTIAITGPGASSGNLIVRAATGSVNVNIFSVSAAGTLTLNRLTLSNGQNAGSGGAIYNPGGTVNVNACTISGNHAINGGTAAGIYSSGTLNVTNSTFSGNQNTTGNGGAIVNFAGTTNVTNTTISGNSGNTNGGGISNFGGGTVNVTNSTITGNTAIGVGGAVGGGIQNASGSTVTVKSSVIAMNSSTGVGPDVRGTFVSAGFNLIGKSDGSTGFTAVTDQTGTVASPLNPLLGPLQNNGGPTQTASVLPGSPALDKGSSSGLTGNLTTDQRGTGFARVFDNPIVPNAPGGDGADIGAYERQAIEVTGSGMFDFDADGKTDLSIFRPSFQSQQSEWWMNRSSNGSTIALPFGSPTDTIAPADFTGDRKTDVAFFRPSTGQWFVLRSDDFSFYSFPFGTTGDVPVPADYDGDGKADAAVFRPSTLTWFISRSSGGTTITTFGAPGDVPVAADYDGDGKADVAIYRPNGTNGTGLGEWWIQRSSTGVVFATQFGNPTDKTVPGDFTGDGKADIAFWRPSTGFWNILRSEDFSFFAFPFGTTGDVPSPGDYDGDGKFDATVFRPSNSTWFANRSTAGVLIQQFGINGDLPIPSAYVR